MSMLLEALKKAALEKKHRLESKTALSNLAEGQKTLIQHIPKPINDLNNEPTKNSNITLPDQQHVDNNDSTNIVDGQTLVQSIEQSVESKQPSSQSLEQIEPNAEEIKIDEPTLTHDWSNELDFSELDSQVDQQSSTDNFDNDQTHESRSHHTEVNDILASTANEEDELIASIVADALAQTEESPQEKSKDSPKDHEHTKEALSQLIQQSKYRENAQHRRLTIIFSCLFIVSVTLGTLYFYFLNSNQSNFVSADQKSFALGSMDDDVAKIEDTYSETNDTSISAKTNVAIGQANNVDLEASAQYKNDSTAKIQATHLQSEAGVTNTTKHTKNTTDKKSTTVKTIATKTTAKKIKLSNDANIQENSNIVRMDPPPTEIESAYNAYSTGNYQKAMNLYLESYARSPENTDVLLGLAASSIKLNKAEDALSYYKRVLRNNPNDLTAQAGLFSITSLQANQPEVESRLLNLLNSNPNDPHLHFLMGNLFSAQQNWVGANKHFYTAVNLEPFNPDYLYNLAISCDQLGRKSDALNYYKEAYKTAQSVQASFSLPMVDSRIRTLAEQMQP